MAIPVDRIRTLAPRWPSEAPHWPCLYFVHGKENEIVSVLFFDGEEAGLGHPVDADGVVRWEETADDLAGLPVGWSLQIICETEPDPRDPRDAAPSVDVWGPELTVADAYERAVEATARRAHALGIPFEASQAGLIWRPG